MAKSSGRPMMVHEDFWSLCKRSGKSAKRFTGDLARELRDVDAELNTRAKKEPIWRFKI